MLNQGFLQKDIPKRLGKDIPGFIIRYSNFSLTFSPLIMCSGSSVRCYIKEFNISTTQNNGLSEVEMGKAILRVIQDDPLGKWGARKVKEKLALESIHISR